MVDALIVSNFLLWILVLALACAVFALVRQIGVLHERIAPAGALRLRGGPRVGESSPELEVESWSGELLRIGGRATDSRDTLICFVSPTCVVCKTLLPVIESVQRAERPHLRVVLASDGPREEHESFVREQHLDPEHYVLSPELGLRFQVSRLPYAVLLDAEGLVRAAGLVNTREHLESLFEARERGVAMLQDTLRPSTGARRVA